MENEKHVSVISVIAILVGIIVIALVILFISVAHKTPTERAIEEIRNIEITVNEDMYQQVMDSMQKVRGN